MASVNRPNMTMVQQLMASYPEMRKGTAADGMRGPRSMRMLLMLALASWLLFLVVASAIDVLVNL